MTIVQIAISTLVALVVLVLILSIVKILNHGNIRRKILSYFGLLKHQHNQGQRCFRCDLYDDERGACLIVVNHPRMGFVNTRVKKFHKCIWRGKVAQFVEEFDVDKNVRQIKSELEEIEKNGFPVDAEDTEL